MGLQHGKTTSNCKQPFRFSAASTCEGIEASAISADVPPSTGGLCQPDSFQESVPVTLGYHKYWRSFTSRGIEVCWANTSVINESTFEKCNAFLFLLLSQNTPGLCARHWPPKQHCMSALSGRNRTPYGLFISSLWVAGQLLAPRGDLKDCSWGS